MNSTCLTVGNSPSAATTPATMLLSEAASGIALASLPRSTRATPSELMSMSIEQFSGSSVLRPIRAASRSFVSFFTISCSVARATPS